MRPADNIEQLLTELRDRTSASFDDRTLGAMFSALDTSITSGTPARSWWDTGRAIMQSRITKLAVAAVLALAVLLLARHLTGGEKPAGPGEKNAPIARVPDNQQAPVPVLDELQQKAQRLAQELGNARECFAAGDAKGLLGLLDTGLDQTKITVAGYLAQMKEESAIPALQWLADRWQGPADDNPFRKSIEQIRSDASQQQGIGGEGRTEAGMSADVRPRTITVFVRRKGTETPIPDAEIQTFVQGETENRRHAVDEKGSFVLDLAGQTPEYVRIGARAQGYVRQVVELWDVRGPSLPRVVHLSLEAGAVIGGTVQNKTGQAVKGAVVEVFSLDRQPAEFEQPRDSIHIELTTDEQGRWRSDEVPAKLDMLSMNIRHPQFADTHFSMPRDLKLEDLRDQRAVMVLNDGLRVTGRVTDEAGTPVAGAGLMAGSSWYSGQWTETDEAGCFRFEPLTIAPLNGTVSLTVQAPGFAPQRRELSVDADLGSVDFVLRPARRLLGRILDSEGKPVADVSVSAGDWNGSNTIKWKAQTDPNGAFRWDYPPEDAIAISLYKAGYSGLQRQVVADDREQTFVLARTMTIRGAVTDSRTGEPIRQFKVVPGTPSGYAGRISWSTSDTVTKWFTDGHYRFEFHFGASAYAVRVEAEGYTSQESGLVEPNEQGAAVDFALSRSNMEEGPSGYVFDANACPIAGAHVVWSETVLIYDGRADVQGRVYTTTDKDGHFVFKAADGRDMFPSGSGRTPFLAVCDRGIGGASYEELVQDGFIMLKPWARVEGQWRIGSRPAAHQELSLWFWHDQALPQAGMDVMTAVTDEDGRFVFEKVYPGKFTLYNEILWATPGRTLEVVVGGEGRIVKGELVMPVASDVPIRTGLTVVPANVPLPFDRIPKPPGYERMSFDEVRTWLERFSDSPEGKAYLKWLSQTDARSFKHLRVDMDDRSRFHVDNVEPGVYILRGEVKSGGFYDGRVMGVAPGQEHLLSKLIGSVWHEFELPPLASDSELDVPLDLGALPVRPATTPRPGDPAPDFDLPTFGEGRIRLADYRGKVVLVTFFMADCLHAYPQGLEELKTVYEHFHEDARYGQIGLFFESYPLLAKKASDEAQLSWPLGLIWEHSGRETREYALPSMALWNVVIDAQGRIFARDLSGETLESAIDAALRTVRRRPWIDR